MITALRSDRYSCTTSVGQHLNLNVIGFDIDDTWMLDYHRRLKNENTKLDAWTI